MQSMTMSQQMQSCIDTCLECYKMCMQTAMNHCLQMGGEHLEPEHFRFMMNCAQMCKTTADFMLSDSRLHTSVCRVCAEVCDACAQSCESMTDMDDCARLCRECAESCRQMSQAEDMDMLHQQDAGSPMMTGQAAQH